MTVRLAVSLGCPCGIGPEVSAAAALDPPKGARVLLVGAPDAVLRTVRRKRAAFERFVAVSSPDEGWSLPKDQIGIWEPRPQARGSGPYGRPTANDGAAQLAWIDAACDLASSGQADAMVTGPVSKEVIASSGGRTAARFLGHTEHLQRRLGAPEVVMAFWTKRFTTALVTTHLPIAKVPRAITANAVASATYWLSRFLLLLRNGQRKPAIAVCSLNPHAGEGGLLGAEEANAIVPGIAGGVARLDRPKAVLVSGPLGAETAFRKAAHRGAYKGIVAMYHDQATIPMKLVSFGESVNVSLGLPIVRTSVDHGTGYDIAGQGIASADGMREAMALAAELARRSARAR
ncbi:MAG TPA: 4-hydroxythreonine-4-phosphate dehydrogenase PdxA [Polyangiaceae bacterium]|jgi:4-hydroxythreonine-4-phosphate dehydrogenase